MNDFALIVPPHYAMRYEDKELGIDYSQWVDTEDRDHISGVIAAGRAGVWVTHPGYRLRIVEDGVEVYEKVTTIIEDLDEIDEIIESVEGKR